MLFSPKKNIMVILADISKNIYLCGDYCVVMKQ